MKGLYIRLFVPIWHSLYSNFQLFLAAVEQKRTSWILRFISDLWNLLLSNPIGQKHWNVLLQWTKPWWIKFWKTLEFLNAQSSHLVIYMEKAILGYTFILWERFHNWKEACRTAVEWIKSSTWLERQALSMCEGAGLFGFEVKSMWTRCTRHLQNSLQSAMKAVCMELLEMLKQL